MSDAAPSPLPAGHKAEQVRIIGRVQGVWYRAWTVQEAEARGLGGWVRNRGDGSVEALFVGPAAKVDDMIAACHRGPEHARVEAVTREPAQGITGHGFRQLPDA
ncbi:MAG: acylphosphatase [Dongiaceae bacterium]